MKVSSIADADEEATLSRELSYVHYSWKPEALHGGEDADGCFVWSYHFDAWPRGFDSPAALATLTLDSWVPKNNKKSRNVGIFFFLITILLERKIMLGEAS